MRERLVLKFLGVELAEEALDKGVSHEYVEAWLLTWENNTSAERMAEVGRSRTNAVALADLIDVIARATRSVE